VGSSVGAGVVGVGEGVVADGDSDGVGLGDGDGESLDVGLGEFDGVGVGEGERSLTVRPPPGTVNRWSVSPVIEENDLPATSSTTVIAPIAIAKIATALIRTCFHDSDRVFPSSCCSRATLATASA